MIILCEYQVRINFPHSHVQSVNQTANYEVYIPSSVSQLVYSYSESLYSLCYGNHGSLACRGISETLTFDA